MPKLIKRGAVWHYSFTLDGQRVRASSKTTDRRLAEDIAVKHEARLRRAAVHGPESVLSFAEAVDLYIEAGKSPRYLLPLLDHFKGIKVARITPPMIRKAAETLYPDGGPATRNRQAITPAQAVINYVADLGLCSPIRVNRYAVTPARRSAGSKEWLAAFQVAARKRGNERLAALARFMFETGARIGQTTALEWGSVNLGEGFAIIRTGKTGRSGAEFWERTAWLTPAMVSELGNFPGERRGKVFRYANRHTVRRAWTKAIEDAGIAPLTPHEAGRHGFATEMIVRSGVDPVTTGERGGWKSKRLLLETYAHADTQRAIIDSVFGAPQKRRPGRK